MLTRSNLILDTDVISFIFDRKDEALFFLPYLKDSTLFITFINIAEIYHGAYKGNWGERRLATLGQYLRRYAVLPYINGLCLEWAKIQSEADEDGHPIGDSDCWVAACARYFNFILLTHNGRHYRYIRGLQLITPVIN